MHNFWDVFAAAVARGGSRTAVEVQRASGLERVTYEDLAARAERVARWLAAQGVAPGDRSAIFADNDADWCAAYLGVFRLGAVAVPLDTSYSASQVATIVSDAGARVLFAGPRLWDTAREAAGSLPGLTLAPVAGPFDPPSDAPPLAPSPATWDDTAVILYTSGTTADPKGVMLSHGNLNAERAAAFAVVDLHDTDSVLGVLPLFHALAQVGNLLLPFALGARVVFLETLNTTELLRALREREISIFVCVPQFFYLIHERVRGEVAKAGAVAGAFFGTMLALNRAARTVGVNLGPTLFRRVHAAMGPRMRLLVTGGSKFDPKIGGELYALGFTILQAYGLTETTGAATINRPDEAHIDTVGRPLPGVEIRIVPPGQDSNNGPVDPSLGGEVAIRGPIVMQGYFNRPDATAAVMRDGWFHTGDLGILDDQGRLQITGRSKEVIVLASGKNLHPEEIEAHYRQSTFIKEVCVLGVAAEDGHMSERLHAVVVPDADVLRAKKIVNAGEQLRFEIEGLTALLPSHKRVLGYDIWMEPLPRTTTGKLRRHEIRRQWETRKRVEAAPADRPLAPEDAAWMADEYVAAAVRMIETAARPGARVVPDANLELDLGLDSMHRVEMVMALERRFGGALDPSIAHEIFTVRHLVEALRPPDGVTAGGEAADPWAEILRDLPPESDPILSGLLEPRPVFGRLLLGVNATLRILLMRVEVRGFEHVPPQGPYIICPNHQSFIDPFLIGSVFPYRLTSQMFFVGATEHFGSPIASRVARLMHVVSVDPNANLVPAMKAGVFGLSRGKILMLFPEGERSIDGTVRRFKKGALILAKHLGVPIVPVALNGAYELWPRNHGPRLRALRWFGSHRLRVTMGPPVTIGTDEDYMAAAERLRGIVAEIWEKAERELGR